MINNSGHPNVDIPMYHLLYKYFLLFALCPFAQQAHAQLEDYRVGARGGISLTHLSGEVTGRHIPRSGFHVAAFIGKPLGGRVSVQAELMMHSAGGITYLEAVSRVLPDNINEAETRLIYATLPLLFRVNLSRWLVLEAGPYLSRRLYADINFRNLSGRRASAPSVPYSISSWEAGLRGGLSLEFKPLRVGLYYMRGLSSSLQSPENTLLPETGYHVVWQAGIGLEI